MSNKKTEVMTVASEEMLAELRAGFPAEEGFNRIQIPRLGMFAQDQTEETKNTKTGKKEIEVVSEAGTYYLDEPTEEENEEGKKIWKKTEIGNEIEGIIIFNRKQLKYYNAKTGEFASSAVYDNADDIVPLFQNGAEIGRGTPAELKAMEQFDGSDKFDKDGNEKSKLEDNRILYVLYNGEMYQMNLRGTSMYAYMSYARKVIVPGVVTKMNSLAKENGAITWSQMTFTKDRTISAQEFALVKEKQTEISDAIAQEKAFYASKAEAKSNLDKFDDADEAEVVVTKIRPRPTQKTLPTGKKDKF